MIDLPTYNYVKILLLNKSNRYIPSYLLKFHVSNLSKNIIITQIRHFESKCPEFGLVGELENYLKGNCDALSTHTVTHFWSYYICCLNQCNLFENKRCCSRQIHLNNSGNTAFNNNKKVTKNMYMSEHFYKEHIKLFNSWNGSTSLNSNCWLVC